MKSMISTRPKLYLAYGGWQALYVVGLLRDGLLSVVLFCGGDSFEDDLRWEPRLGGLVDLVEFEDSVFDGGFWRWCNADTDFIPTAYAYTERGDRCPLDCCPDRTG